MEKKSLPELTLNYLEIERELVESGGLLSPEMERAQFDLTEKLEEKVEGYKYVMERLEHSSKYYAAKADEFAKVARGLSHAKDFLHDNLKAAMTTMEKTEILAGSVRVALVKCPKRLVVISEEALPQEYVELVPKPNLARIKQSLEAGESVPGAELTGGVALRFYMNREVK